MLGLRAAEEIGDIKLVLIRQRGQEVGLQAIERRWIHRLVAVVPPDDILGQLILDGELVLRAPARVLAGPHDKRAVLGEKAFATTHGMFDQRRSREIPENLGTCGNALLVQTATRSPIGHFRTFPSWYVKSGGGPWPAAACLCSGPINRKRCPVKTA